MRIPDRLMPHVVTITSVSGNGSEGAVFGTPVTVRAQVLDKRKRLIGDAGVELVSSTQVFLDPDVAAPVNSLVTVWSGTGMERTGKVLEVSYFEDTHLPSYKVVYVE